MSTTLWLLRLRRDYRIPESDPLRRCERPIIGAFPSRQAAEQYARDCYPDQINPFDKWMDGFGPDEIQSYVLDDDDNDEQLFPDDTPPPDPLIIPVERLMETIYTFGLAPPAELVKSKLRTKEKGRRDDEWYRELWVNWWEAHRDRMTVAQRQQLFRMMDPAPYVLTGIEVE